jgi:hypothetical protein
MQLVVTAIGVGTDSLDGNLTVKYTFPPGVVPAEPEEKVGRLSPVCGSVGQVMECTLDVTGFQPDLQIRLQTTAEVASDATGGAGEIEVSGGGAPDVFTDPFSVSVGQRDPFSITTFDVGIAGASSLPATRAGSNLAELTTAFEVLSEAQTNLEIPNPNLVLTAPTENFRDVVVHVPPGFVGNPLATPSRCTPAQLTTTIPFTSVSQCPPDSQVGLVEFPDLIPLYSIDPPAGKPAEFGFFYQGAVIALFPKLRPSDNGIDIVSEKTSTTIPIPSFQVSLWGDPTAASHDRLRGLCTEKGYGHNDTHGDCSLSSRSDVPFFRTPTSCPGTPLPWTIEMNTYEHVDTWVQKETSTPAMEGCEDNPFDPTLLLAPSNRAAHSSSGLDVELTIPQDAGINGLAEADLRSATVELPEGVSLNPAAADGLAACSDAQLRLGLEGPSNCPDAAKVGSLELVTPLLEDPIGGSIYIRSQASNDPASGDLYRLVLEIRSDERGVDIKLPGSLKVDPNTGQLTTSFTDLPQLPFESMQLHLKSGPRAPLTTPSTCGTYTSHAVLTGWNDKTVTTDPSFTIDQNCTPAAFAPGFEAGVENATAGEYSPFILRVTRDPDQPNLSRIDATLPAGEAAKFAGVPLCPDAQAATGACPAASQIGRVVAGVGSGSNPLYLPQAGHAPTAVYLAGPYKGGPFSIVSSVPAQAGPFDLGTVTVRSALRVDLSTAQGSVLSDPLPQIFGGIPVSYRDVRVIVDRPEFALNPTSCEPKSVVGTIGAINGASANVADRFQMTDCAALGFKPKLRISLRGTTHRAGHPALKAVLTYPKKGDYANIARAQVTLPHSAFLDQGHIKTVCNQTKLKSATCPKDSIYGRAKAWSPLLDKPLEGPVYLGVGYGHELPDLVADLNGQIRILLNGKVDTGREGALRTTFELVPDAPVSRFVLEMQGGRKGLLVNSENLCSPRAKHKALGDFVAQNGRALELEPVVTNSCKAKRHGRRR